MMQFTGRGMIKIILIEKIEMNMIKKILFFINERILENGLRRSDSS